MFKRFWTIFSLGAPDWLRQYVGMNELNLLNADKLPAFYIFNRTVLICPRSWMCWISLSIESRWGREIPLTEITKSWSLIAVAYMLVMKWIVLSNITWKFSFLACVILWSLTAELKLGEGDERRGDWVSFCWVCAAGLSEPLAHYIVYSVDPKDPILALTFVTFCLCI